MRVSPEKAAAVKFKASLHAEILREVKKRKLKARQPEQILDQPQPRISELLSGRILKRSTEKLAGYLSRLGIDTKTSANSAI